MPVPESSTRKGVHRERQLEMQRNEVPQTHVPQPCPQSTGAVYITPTELTVKLTARACTRPSVQPSTPQYVNEWNYAYEPWHCIIGCRELGVQFSGESLLCKLEDQTLAPIPRTQVKTGRCNTHLQSQILGSKDKRFPSWLARARSEFTKRPGLSKQRQVKSGRGRLPLSSLVILRCGIFSF